jgi:hypothetical protein
MIICITFALLTMHLPELIVSVFLTKMFNHNKSLVIQNIVNYNLFVYSSQFYFDLANLFYFINFSFSFFFNMMFNHVFRSEFFNLFGCCFLKRFT